MKHVLPYIISSRVRLARNLQDYPFPDVACRDERKAVVECVRNTATKMAWFPQVDCIDIDQLHPLDRRVLEEKRLISHFLLNQGTYRFVMIANSFAFSLLVNEEDHLRIQSIQPGLRLRKAWGTVKHLEQTLQEKLDFAHSEKYGYLTRCASNRGTGIRISVMAFLPGLILSKRITGILQQLIASGYAARGVYGEGSQSFGYLLQISKQISYKKHEKEALRDLEQVCAAIIKQEQRARIRMLTNGVFNVKKTVRQIGRALSKTELIGFRKGMRMLAVLRLDRTLRIEQDRLRKRYGREEHHLRSLSRLDELSTAIQPAHVLRYGLQNVQSRDPDIHKKVLSTEEDALRAKMIQWKFGIRG